MCALKQSSILRTVDPAILQSFLWQAFCVEAKKITLYTILDQLLEVREFPSEERQVRLTVSTNFLFLAFPYLFYVVIGTNQ